MDKTNGIFKLLGLGISIGVILTVIVVLGFGAKPRSITFGGVEFDISTAVTAPKTISTVQQAMPQPQPTTDFPTRLPAPTRTNVVSQSVSPDQFIRDYF